LRNQVEMDIDGSLVRDHNLHPCPCRETLVLVWCEELMIRHEQEGRGRQNKPGCGVVWSGREPAFLLEPRVSCVAGSQVPDKLPLMRRLWIRARSHRLLAGLASS